MKQPHFSEWGVAILLAELSAPISARVLEWCVSVDIFDDWSGSEVVCLQRRCRPMKIGE